MTDRQLKNRARREALENMPHYGDQTAQDRTREFAPQLHTERESLCFNAGHRQGWRDCLSTLKVHGVL